MEPGSIVEYFENKTILVTGATGFLAKIFVEKVLRVQPNVKKLYLLLRAADDHSANLRLQDEIIGKDLFNVLREKYGSNLNSFISQKVKALPGDISIDEDLGIEDCKLKNEMLSEINVVVNFAASINFEERYDDALSINTMGSFNVLKFAKKCPNIKMFNHISTAYDFGLERARGFGWPNTYVFTKALGEMLLLHHKGDLPLVIMRPTMITSTIKDPFPGWIEGVRTIDSLIVGYGKGKLTCFVYLPYNKFDLIPADMVVNAIIVAMVAQGEPVKIGRGTVLSSMTSFHLYMNVRYLLPFKGLQLANSLMFRKYQDLCTYLDRKIKLVMRLVQLYKPYILFEGIFEDSNSEKLRITTTKTNPEEAEMFNFDPTRIEWEDYMMSAHVPGLAKYSM
ncbi:Fatty acyl-CoA reductase 1 [Euphorbia peplus]|nr:Fatty acyl-CoA reductase 1 [Euphorbia peplus]